MCREYCDLQLVLALTRKLESLSIITCQGRLFNSVRGVFGHPPPPATKDLIDIKVDYFTFCSV